MADEITKPARKTWTTATALMKRVGVARRTFYDHQQSGAPPPRADGKYCIETYTTWLKAREQGREAQSAAGTMSAEKRTLLQSRLLLRRCEQVEHELAVQRGEWVRVEQVKADTARAVQAAKTILLALPTALAPELSGLAPAAIEKILRDRITEALTHLAKEPWPV